MANETAKATIYLEGKQAEAALDSLSKRGKQLRKDFEEAQKAGDNIKMNKLEKQIRDVEAAQRSLRKESFDVQKVLQNLNGSSLRDLERALGQTRREWKRMSETDPGFKEKTRDLITLKNRYAELNSQQQVTAPLWTRMANGANKYFNMLTIGVGVLTGFIFSASEFVKGMVGLDDALADVMKTTGLTRSEVRGMYSDFSYMNTRTPRKELLALAEEAGRLGKTGKKDIQDFVEVANKIKIALGDDLGGNAEEAIREVGKLTEIFKIGDQYGTDFKVSMEKVGSGINTVANNSNASAGYLIEYMKRLGGTAVQARISAADIMGYAATFDQLGQNVEMAATAQSKIVVDMFTDPAKYARIAKVEVGEFTKLLQTNANQAFIKFLEGLNGNNEGLSVMATKLDDLGIDGARAIQALSALSSNTKMLKEQQDTANEAMQKGVSLNNEYAIKNENLAGSFAKITAYIHSKFINSGVISFFEKLIGKTAEWIAQPVEAKLRAEQAELNVLVGAITNVNATQENRNSLIAEMQKNYPDFLGNLDAEKVTNEELKKRLEEVNQQYEDKILLTIKEDALQKNYKERTDLKIKELDLIKQIAAAEKIAIEARKKITPGMDANSYRNVLTQQEFNALNNLPILNSALADNRTRVDELKAAEAELNTALTALMKNRVASTSGGTGGTGGTGGGSIGMSDEAKKAASEKAIELLGQANNKRMELLVKQYEREAWTDERWKAEQLVAELAYLEQKKAILIQFGQSTVQVEQQINQQRAALNKEMLSEELKNLYAEMENDQAIINNAVKSTIDAADETMKKLDNLKDKEKELLQQRKEAYMNFGIAVGQSFGQLMNDSEATYADYLKNTLLMALEAFHQFFILERAKAIIKSAGDGPLALFTAAAKIAAMELAYQGAKAAITSLGGKGSYSSGGDTGPGGKYEPAGIVHKREYVIPSEGTENPGLRPFIDLMEIARRNGSLAQLDLRPVMASAGASRSYASGGFAGTSTSPGATTITFPAGLDKETANRLTQAIDKLTEWQPVLAVETYEKKAERYREISNGGLK